MSDYQVWGADGFDIEAEPYLVTAGYEDYGRACAAATALLAELDESQSNAGGQEGIQDRVYVRHPDGHMERRFA